MDTLERIAASIKAHKRVVDSARDTGTPIIGLHSYHSDPDTIVSTKLDEEISVMLGLPRRQYIQAYSGSLGHPGTEATLALCGDATRIDAPGSVRDRLFTDAIISTNDSPSPHAVSAYHPSEHRYITLLKAHASIQDSTWPDLTKRVLIEKDHHSHRQRFNSSNEVGYSLICEHMGSATAIALLQLQELHDQGHRFDPEDSVGLIAAIKYAMHVDTQGFNDKQMSSDDRLALDWLERRFFGKGQLAYARAEAFHDLCNKPVPEQWTSTSTQVQNSEAYRSSRQIFIADLGVVSNRMIIPYIADTAFKGGDSKQAVIVFGLYAEREKGVQSNALLFSGRSKGLNGEFKEIFKHCINIVVEENGKPVEKYQGGGRDTGLLGGITMCGNSIPLYCDPHETSDDLVHVCGQEEEAYLHRIVNGFRDIAHIEPSSGAFYSLLADRSSRFEQAALQTFK